jgi:hypothetical protein
MPDPKSSYEWKENNACVATYKVLEGDMFLDQFEDAAIPFDKAGEVKLKALRYFPQTTVNPQIIDALSMEISRQFIKYITKVYTVQKQDPKVSSADIIIATAEVFAGGNNTIRDLAAVVDQYVKFPDE